MATSAAFFADSLLAIATGSRIFLNMVVSKRLIHAGTSRRESKPAELGIARHYGRRNPITSCASTRHPLNDVGENGGHVVIKFIPGQAAAERYGTGCKNATAARYIKVNHVRT